MKITVDTERELVIQEEGLVFTEIPMYSKEGFELLSKLWAKVGWNEKYSYTFSWMGRPVIQLPEDLIRVQEVIYNLKPDVIIETGVAHGGSLIFYASLCKAIGKGKIIGIDIDIRKHNRDAIEVHELSEFITLLEGSSTEQLIVERVKDLIQTSDTVLVILDSDHSKAHVLAELEAYHGIVSPGSYIVATDGIMYDLYDTPRGNPEWQRNNPIEAVKEFLIHHPNFKEEQPEWPFNESQLSSNITHWPMAWLRKLN